MFLKYLNCVFCSDSTSDFVKIDHVSQLNISLGRNTDLYNHCDPEVTFSQHDVYKVNPIIIKNLTYF